MPGRGLPGHDHAEREFDRDGQLQDVPAAKAGSPRRLEPRSRVEGQKLRRSPPRPLPPYCFGLAPADSSLANLTRALSSFFCTLFTSPGSASAGTVLAYSCRLCSHWPAAIFRRPVFSYNSPRWSWTAGSWPMRSLALRRLASESAYWPILK